MIINIISTYWNYPPMISSIVFALFSLVLFGVGVFFYKLGTPGFSTGAGASVYIASHLIVLGALAIMEVTKYDKAGLKYLVIGGIFSGLAQVFFFMSLKYGDTHVVVPIRNLSLLVTVLLGVFVLSESISSMKILGLLFGVVAIILLSI